FQGVTQTMSGTWLPRNTDPMLDKVRVGASVHIISLTDTNDQSPATAAQFIGFLNNIDNAGGKATMHGIICPEGAICYAGEGQIDNPAKIHVAIRATGGVVGDIQVANTGGAAAQAQLANYVDAILSA